MNCILTAIRFVSNQRHESFSYDEMSKNFASESADFNDDSEDARGME